MRKTLAQIAGLTTPPQRYRDGGHVRGPGTGTSDSINIKASNGEFVLPTDTVRKVGIRRLQDLVSMTHEPSGKSPHPAQFADGGLVRRPSSFDMGGWVQQQEQQRAASTQASQAAGQEAMAQGEAAAQEAADAKRRSTSLPSPTAAPAGGSTAAPESQSLSQRVAQIPTGGQTAPAADGSQNSWSNTEAGRNLSNIASALPGSLGGAVPAVAKTGGAISGGLNAASRLMNAAMGAGAISALPGSAAAQSQPTSPAGAGRGMVNPPAVDPSLPPPASPPKTLASIAAGLSAPTSDVTRVGNSYSGTNVAGDITVNGRAAGGGFMDAGGASAPRSTVGPNAAYETQATGQSSGQSVGAWERLMAAGTGQAPSGRVSTQNMAAADNLAASQQRGTADRTLMSIAMGMTPTPTVQSPVVRHSGNDWASRNDLRNMEVSASSIKNRPEWQSGSSTQAWSARGSTGAADPDGKVAAYRAALSNDLGLRGAQATMDQTTMRENAGLRREGLQQQGATNRAVINAEVDGQRNQIERGKLSLAQIAAGYDNRSRERMDRAQSDLEAAKTPEVQRSARERLLALGGHAPQNEWALQVTPATKNLDGSTNQGSVFRYNKTTGETVRVDGGQQMDIAKDPRALAIRDNPKLNYEQKRAELAKLGF